MPLFKRPAPKPLSRQDALACVPIRSRDAVHEELDSGLIRITYPLIYRPWFCGIMDRMGLGQPATKTRTIELDELGTATWKLIDGDKSVEEITRRFAEQHSLLQRESELTVSAFINELGKRGIIALRPSGSE